jgi:glycosyltransferase involved in cell wall biosynthesis
MKLRGLFLNTAQARCSIHESGLMAYQALIRSDRYSLEYQEIDKKHRRVPTGFDFFVFNYHLRTSMSWVDTRCIRRLPGLKTTLVLEVAPNNPFVEVSPDDFDCYLVLDPTITPVASRVYPFPRPLEEVADLPIYEDSGRPVIGTFGLPTSGKGFDKIVEAVNREFDSALIRMNIPSAQYINDRLKKEVNEVIATCRKLAKPGVEVLITHDFMSKADLIRWCARNTLNCFLYNRSMPGLAATTDQAISSGRPLAVSDNDTFRHLYPYLTPYPQRSLKESIAVSQSEVEAMQRAWSPAAFAREFEQVLDDHPLVPAPARKRTLTLRSNKSKFRFITKLYHKARRRFAAARA